MAMDPKNLEIALSIAKKLFNLITGAAMHGNGITDEALAEAMTEYDNAKDKLAALAKKVGDADDY